MNLLVDDPYKQALALWSNAHTLYMVPTSERAIFWFFLKSMNAKYSAISPKAHSTDTLTLLIALLNCFSSSVRLLCLKGA